MVICLERGADLHMAQLMPLPLAVPCFSKIQIGFTFLVPAHPGSPGKRAVKRVCVCVCVKIVKSRKVKVAHTDSVCSELVPVESPRGRFSCSAIAAIVSASCRNVKLAGLGLLVILYIMRPLRRIHCMRVRPIFTDVAWSACACVSVGHSREPYTKTDEPIKVPFGISTRDISLLCSSMGPRNHMY